MWPPLISATDAMEMVTTGTESIKFVDASWFLDKSRDPKAEHITERIRGAVHFDIDSICQQGVSLPHMLPDPEFFARKMSDLGVSNHDSIIVYESGDCFGAPRVWWTFRAFSHLKVSVLDGGLRAWKAVDGPLESGAPSPASDITYSTPALNTDIVASKEDVIRAMRTGIAQIADARSSGRFYGTAPEPRPGLASGHVPGSLNIPFTTVLDTADASRLKPVHELQEVFAEAGVVPGARVIATCGSGVTASVLALARHVAGEEVSRTAVYDGSWSEWGADDSLPKSTYGAAPT